MWRWDISGGRDPGACPCALASHCWRLICPSMTFWSARQSQLDRLATPAQQGRAGVKNSQLREDSSVLTAETMKDINLLLVKDRISARSAYLTSFHKLLQRLIDEGRVVRCLTRNYDGLETRDRPELQPKVTMLHGDNRILICSNLDCTEIGGEGVAQFDANFLNREAVQCPGCLRTRKWYSKFQFWGGAHDEVLPHDLSIRQDEGAGKKTFEEQSVLPSAGCPSR